MGGDFRKSEYAVLISNAVVKINYLTNSKFISPLAFAERLLLLNLSHEAVEMSYYIFKKSLKYHKYI